MAHQLTQLPAGGEAIPKDRMVWIEAALLRSLAASHADARQDFLNVLGLQAEATRAALILLKAADGSGGPAMELVARWSAGGESFGADELRLRDFGLLDDSPHRPAWLSFPGPAGARSLALPFGIARQEIEHAPPPGDAGVVVLELRGSAGPPDAALGLDPDRISFLAALAVGLGKIQEELRRLPLARCEPLPADAIAYRLEGEPQLGSLPDLFARFPEIAGRSAAMAGLLQSILVAAGSDIPVLIEGESGTGKELVARAIHRSSRRADRAFLCENCAALPESLAEAELFGHERGAFTGAERRRLGIFERSAGGTVFLDEVGEMDLSLQRKLLRVLQERELRRVGGHEVVPLDFRLVSATNRVLEEMVVAGRFREDLFFRLNVATITVPPLRERAEDIPLLIEHFGASLAAERGRRPIELTSRATEALATYPWPGNVRELRNEVWRLTCTDRVRIDAEHLNRRILRGAPLRAERSVDAPPASLHEVEKQLVGSAIAKALRRAGGNRAEAARILGITRSTLYRRLRKYGMDRTGFATDGEVSSASCLSSG